MLLKTPSQMTRGEIEARLEEAEINRRSYGGDDEHELEDLYFEIEELETALHNGDYLNCEEE